MKSIRTEMRSALLPASAATWCSIRQFIIDHKIVTLTRPQGNPHTGVHAWHLFGRIHGAPACRAGPINPEAQVESRLREYNNYTLKWLTMHEALPGHYVQAEHADDVQPLTRRVLRNVFGNGAYVEGWAEYGSDVMTQAGYLDFNPKFKLVRLKVQLRVAANAILDIRMQTMNMTDQQALDLMTKECFQTQAEAEGKLTRIKLSSTQLPTYFVGTRQWWALRKKYQAAKGDKLHAGRIPRSRARPRPAAD